MKVRQTDELREADRRIGAVIRERRILLGLTQQNLADAIGVTYQQAHKYERGINRISAGRLQMLARVLRMQPAEFFAPVASEASPRERLMLDLSRNLALLPEAEQESVAALVRAMLASRSALLPKAA